ncbi:MAG: hydroxyisourate hydrolase [Rhodospirillales bacterium]|nr:hydroxyisourate hydrolase [Rhodospirillales bacterium]
MAGLTTHVLDTASGRPADGVRVELFTIDNDTPARLLATATTDADGRTDGPLIEPAAMAAGRYELIFHVGEYFAGRGYNLPEPSFLDRVPVRFAISDATQHYHVPLLVTPWSYTTYRGS